MSGHGLSVHPGWTVLLGRRTADVQNGRIHPSSEGDVTNRQTMPCVSPLLTFIATGRTWPDLSRHRVEVWDRLALSELSQFLQRFKERVYRDGVCRFHKRA